MSRLKGDHKFVCDIDGMVYHSRHKRITWDGKVVHHKNYYPRHMSELRRAVKEDTSVKNPRPEVGYGSTDGDGYRYSDDALLNDLCYLWDGDEYIVDEDGEIIEGCPWPDSGGF